MGEEFNATEMAEKILLELEGARDDISDARIEIERLNAIVGDLGEELANAQKAAVAAEKRVAELEKELKQEKDNHDDTKKERNDALDERDDFRDRLRETEDERDDLRKERKTYEADFNAWRAMIRARNAFDTYQNHPTDIGGYPSRLDYQAAVDRFEKEWLNLEQLSAKIAEEAWQGD